MRPQLKLVTVIAVVVVGVVGCSPQPTGASKRRARVLADDPIKSLLPPGGRLLGEGVDPGHPDKGSPFGPGPPTVSRTYSFTGDSKTTAVSVVRQARQAGWSVRPDCDTGKEGDYLMSGGKQFAEFRAGLQIQVSVRPPEPVVIVKIATSFPGEEPATDRLPFKPFGPPDCLTES